MRESYLQVIESRLQAIGSRLQAIGSRLQAIGSRLQVIESRLQVTEGMIAGPRIKKKMMKEFHQKRRNCSQKRRAGNEEKVGTGERKNRRSGKRKTSSLRDTKERTDIEGIRNMILLDCRAFLKLATSCLQSHQPWTRKAPLMLFQSYSVGRMKKMTSSRRQQTSLVVLGQHLQCNQV